MAGACVVSVVGYW